MTGTSTGMTSRTRRGYGGLVTWLAVAIVLAWSSVCAATVQNPGFEDYYIGTPYPRQLPSNWWHTDHSSFNSKCNSLWSTDGILSAGLYSLVNKPVSPGNFEGFHQFVDLTGVGSIAFDIRLAAYPEGAFQHFQAEFLVDGVPVWHKGQEGIYLNEKVNVSNKSGYHRVEMRITAVDAGMFPTAYWTQWDNIRLVEGATAIKAAVRLDPETLNLSSNGNWITGYIELEAGYDPNGINGATVMLGDSVPAYTREDEQGWATPEANGENVADFDEDGIDERMVKFDRSAVQELVQTPETTVTVMVRGKMFEDGRPFEGPAVIRVIDKGPKAK
jgi:hypothetical protein